MAKAKRLPSGNFRVLASFTDDDGVQHRASFTSESAKVAEARAAMWQAGMIEKEKNKRSLPLGDALDQYIESCRCSGISPSTIRSYVSSRNNAYEQIIHKRVDKLTVRDVQAWLNERSKIVSAKTCRNNLNLMTAALKSNGVSIDTSVIKTRKVQRTEIDIPSDAQIIALLDAVNDCDDMYIAIALAALMGLRRSEICALRWSDINVVDNVARLSVTRALVRDENGLLVEKCTKTNSGTRVLVIPPALYAEIRRRRQLRPTLVAISPNAITERYKRLVDRLSLPNRFHALRHYHASVMLREGVPEKYICADMGHSTFDMVKRVYGHVMGEKMSYIEESMANHAATIIPVEHENAHAAKNI